MRRHRVAVAGAMLLLIGTFVVLPGLLPQAMTASGQTPPDDPTAGWLWVWRQPPYEFLVINEHVYIRPYADVVAWQQPGSDTLFAMTNGEASVGPPDLYISADRGASWQNSFIDGLNVTDVLVVHPVTPTIVFAAGENMSPPGGVFRSEDGGLHWTNVLSNTIVYDIEVDPHNPERVYAATCCLPPPVGTGGIYRSDDLGQTWEMISEQWLHDLEVHPSVPGRVLGARFFSTGADEGVYRSDDGGTTWTHIAGIRQSRIVIDPRNPDRVFAFGGERNGILRSDDGGTSWVDVTDNLPHPLATAPTILSATLDPNLPDTIWVGQKYSGIFVSHTAGGAWVAVNDGLPFILDDVDGPQCSSISITADGKYAVACSGWVFVGLPPGSLDNHVYLPLVMGGR